MNWDAIKIALELALIPAVGWLVNAWRKHRRSHTLLEGSQRAQLRSSIINDCRIAIMRGYITPLELESITDQFEWYEKMDGNGTVHTYVTRAKALPLREE